MNSYWTANEVDLWLPWVRSDFASCRVGIYTDLPSTMLLSRAVRTVEYYALVLQTVSVDTDVDLHWSSQPGVTDGCLEFYESREAAFEAYKAADIHWLGLEGPRLVLAVLCIRADYLNECIMAGTMTRLPSKLRNFRNMRRNTPSTLMPMCPSTHR